MHLRFVLLASPPPDCREDSGRKVLFLVDGVSMSSFISSDMCVIRVGMYVLFVSRVKAVVYLLFGYSLDPTWIICIMGQ